MGPRHTSVLFCILLLGYAISSYSSDIPNHAVILQYHHVSETTPAITSIMPEVFDQHLAYLEQQGFNIASLEQVIRALQAKQALPDKTVVITFDDAYLSIYQQAWPKLAARGWPFALFVSTALIGSNPDQYMDWNQLRELRDAGVLIANHTMHHTHLLRKLDQESELDWLQRIRGDITGAQETLERELGQAPKFFAYPYGEYSDEVKQVLKELDYVSLGQQSGATGESTDWQEVPRFPASGIYSDLASLKEKLTSLPFPVTSSMPDSLLTLEDTRPVLSVSLAREMGRIEQLACYATAQGAIDIIERSSIRFSTRAKLELPVGRSRYNCTLPSLDGSRYYWMSQPWVRRYTDGSWYPED